MLCIPPWMFAAAEAPWVSTHSDRTHGASDARILLCRWRWESCCVRICDSQHPPGTNPSLYNRFFGPYEKQHDQTSCVPVGIGSHVRLTYKNGSVALAPNDSFAQSSNMIVGARAWTKAWGSTYGKLFVNFTATALVSTTYASR